MKISISIALLILFNTPVFAQQKYVVNLDLQNVKKDKVFVEVYVPTITKSVAVWAMPAIIPGTYAQYDFGRFISNFKAYDIKGKRLRTERKNQNEIVIFDAEKLTRVSYKVSDTWDASVKENYVFQPAGTNIEKGKNIVLNHHGFIGYISGFSNFPYEINVKKPTNFYSNTSLKVKNIDTENDVEYANNYVHLADNPTLYCIADTISFRCNNTRVHIGSYSAAGIVSAKNLVHCIKPLANALALFFNVLPVNDYNFIFYFSGTTDHKVWGTGASGALEHNYSSFYFLPEMQDTVALYSFVKDVAAHEFLHILTPLNVHSFEIENFDFLNPKLSQHLWLYEGVTEYFSQLVQVRSGLLSEAQFIENMHYKIEGAAEYPPFSFTEMSKNVCVAPYKDYYDNVYQKGALLAFLLDLQLTKLSNNKFGLPELMQTLSKKYGPDKPFEDNKLFEEIKNLTHPKIESFFNDYVIDKKELPYEEYFNYLGWTYKDSLVDSVFQFGKFGISVVGENSNFYKVVKTTEEMNLFRLKNKDRILAINDKKVEGMDWGLFETIVKPKNNKRVKLTVVRKGKNIELTAVPRKKITTKKYEIQLNKEFSKQQIELRNKIYGDVKESK